MVKRAMSNPIVTGLAGWGIHATRASFTPCTGAGIKIALLDTGFQPPHPDFKSRQIVGQSFVPSEDPMDRVGHGTHCGALACGPLVPAQYPRYGIAGGAQMWVLKVLGNFAATKTEWLMAGIEMAIQHRCEIVCLPLGQPVRWGVPYAVHWEFLAQRALASGVLLMAAAGDESRRSRNVRWPPDSPANCPSIVAVGAVDAQMRVADFSNGGVSQGASGVDLVAPGVDIFSAYLAPTSYRLLSGTSQAVALAAGIAALHAEKTGLRGDALRAELKRTAKPLPLDAADVGAGLVQAPV
jgi:subtilisin family serine protease